jgi:putative transposase
MNDLLKGKSTFLIGYKVRTMLKTFEYRLYPNRRQRKLLTTCLAESRKLYNEMLEQVEVYHAETGRFLFRYSLNIRFKGRGKDHVPQTTVQCLADRMDKAITRFITRKELDEKAGFPRFKSANRWHSIHLRQFGKNRDVWLEGDRLRVPGKLGRIFSCSSSYPLTSRIVGEEACHVSMFAARPKPS